MEKIYCIYCGRENIPSHDKCKYCGKKLKEKDHEFINYILDEIGDEIKGNFIDKFIMIMKKLTKKYLYGTLLTISVIASTTTTIYNALNNKKEVPQIVRDEYNFQSLSNEEKLLGCYRGTNIYETDEIRYFKFYDLDKYISVSIDSDGNKVYNKGYYLVFDEEGYTSLYLGPRKVVEAQYFHIAWDNDNVFRYGELGYYETKYERILCDDFPIEEDEL